MLILFGPDSSIHDFVQGSPGDFDRVCAAARAARDRGESPGLTIGLTRRNFFAVDLTVRLAAELVGAEPPDVDPPYSIRPVGRIHTNLTAYIKKLLPFFYRSGIEMEFTDPDLAAILLRAEAVAGPTNERELLRLLGVIAGRPLTGPKSLLIDALFACNLDCVYCNNFAARRQQAHTADPIWETRDKVLSFETFANAIRDAQELGVEAISIVGGGEPLLHPRIGDMLALIAESGLAMHLSTNGTNLTPELARRAAEAAPRAITFSVSGCSEESYRKLHPSQKPGTWSRVMESARGLRRLRDERGASAPQLIALHVLCNVNYEEPEALVRASAEYGFDEVWLQLVHIRDFCGHLAMNPDQIATCRRNVERARRLAADLGLGFSNYIDFQLANIRPDGTWSKGSFVDRGCLVGWDFAVLTCGGDISFCCAWKFIDNMNGKGFRAVWESDRYNSIRRAGVGLGHRDNPVMTNNKRLFDESCFSCDNHDMNREMFDLLERYDLLRYVTSSRDPEAVNGFPGENISG